MGTGDAAVHRERKKKILKENPEIFTLIGMFCYVDIF
jgi:hypothetical protein